MHFFGWIDWLVRAHTAGDINTVLYGRKPINSMTKIKLEITRKTLVLLNWIVSKKSLDLSKRRNLPQKIVASAIKNIGKITDKFLMALAFLEWYFFKHLRNGSEQFLVFTKC